MKKKQQLEGGVEGSLKNEEFRTQHDLLIKVNDETFYNLSRVRKDSNKVKFKLLRRQSFNTNRLRHSSTESSNLSTTELTHFQYGYLSNFLFDGRSENLTVFFKF